MNIVYQMLHGFLYIFQLKYVRLNTSPLQNYPYLVVYIPKSYLLERKYKS